MFEKIKKLQQNRYVDQFRDIRAVGFVVFGVLVLLVSYSGVNVIQTNYHLQKRLAELEQKNDIAQLENNNQKLQNQYYATDQYLELVAREHFGKAFPGETELQVSKDVALAHTIAPVASATRAQPKRADKPTYQKNLETWRDFFLRGSAQLR